MWRDRKFCSIELIEQKDAVTNFQKYLSKLSVTNESAKVGAEKTVQTYAERANIQTKDQMPSLSGDSESRRIAD